MTTKPARLPKAKRPRLDSRMKSVSVIDIGASSVICIIAVARSASADSSVDNPENEFEVAGIGVHASPGLSGGGIDDLQAMETAVRHAVDKAETQLGHTISSAYVNVSAGPFTQERCRLDIELNGATITQTHVSELYQPLLARPAPKGYVVLKTTPHNYIVDHNRVVKDPRGLHASTLTAEVHRLFVPLSPIEDTVLCVHRCHLEVEGVIATADASAHGAMAAEEMRHGAILLDIGAGSTALSIFRDNELYYLSRIPVAGHHFTKDLAHGIGIDTTLAERIKVLHGTVSDPGAHAAPISVPQPTDPTGENIEISPRQVAEILEPRAAELIELIGQQLDEAQYKTRTPRIILTGGGSLLPGLREMIMTAFDAHVRIAKPRSISGIHGNHRSPAFSTAVGMLYMGFDVENHNGYADMEGAVGRARGLFQILKR